MQCTLRDTIQVLRIFNIKNKSAILFAIKSMIDSLNQTVQKYSEIVYIISSNVLQYSEISMYT